MMAPTVGPIIEPRSLPWHAAPAGEVMVDLEADRDRGLTWASWAVILGLGVAKFLAVEVEKAFWRSRGVQQL